MKVLIYCVDKTDASFIVEDIINLSFYYDWVYLFTDKYDEAIDSLPSNVLKFNNYLDWSSYDYRYYLWHNLMSIIKIYIQGSIVRKRFLALKETLALLCSNIFKAEQINRQINEIKTKHEVSVHGYSFWFYDCIFLAWMKQRNYIDLAFARTHGGDLYEERSSLKNKVLLREYQLGYLDYIFSVSRAGEEYLKKRYPKYARKVKTSYLGTKDYGGPEVNMLNEVFVLVSCAHVRDVKRIYKIAETLMYIDYRVDWYHIGNENLDNKNDPTTATFIDNLNALSKKKNIRYNPLGKLNHSEVSAFYKANKVDLFISLSETEGIPVSMMEAISFGVPILSTDVGGCSELVNKNTGLLIPSSMESANIAKEITRFKDSGMNTEKFRAGVRQYWLKEFEIKSNYRKFFKEINR